MSARRLIGGVVSASLLAFCALPIHAQTVPASPADIAQEGLRRQEERAREQQQHLKPDADLLQPARPTTISDKLPEESPCFPIQGVELTGPDATRFAWLADAALPYLRQCAGAAGLRQIASALDARLIEQGYVTSRVSLPQQNLKEGILTIRLHVGRIAGISLNQAANPKAPDDSWGTWRNAFPVSGGDILNVRDLEQGVEQMKRLPSQAVATELEPGEEPDTSRLRILRQPGSLRERFRGGVTLDNAGTPALGRPQLSSYASLDNPLGLNDILSLSASSNLERLRTDHRSQNLSLQYSIPWGYNTFTLGRSHSRFAQIVQGTTARFLSSGSSDNTDLRWHRILLRTSSAKSGLYASLGTRRASSFLDDVELVVQRRRTTTLETGLTHKQLLGDASIDLELGYRRGVSWRGAQDDLPTAAEGGLTVRPTITVASAGLSLPFTLAGRPMLHTTALRVQHTRDLTLSVDQFAIGSQYSVRGFDGEAVLLAESGYTLRNEWSTPLRLADGLDSVAFAAVDVGRVWGTNTANLVGDRLAGAAFGVRGRWQQLQFDAALGTPLYRPQGFKSRRFNPYLAITWAF
ncbi:hemolysin activation/secretion protein [Noviherbaspirillum humi]|uniref:Hemolysin activation/secretion protein n=1 Tax=Noviherbaspirillum humi TaxID=1688639 RepID=A0A239K5P6_9BURK|nr:ShlB/FhaC/HecB family hemolysin secretion/activation protein [Noviherbaspirillum humi]SNT12973.1 hemolysin activation/secretion protein [Noviherbaspirillum humi]